MVFCVSVVQGSVAKSILENLPKMSSALFQKKNEDKIKQFSKFKRQVFPFVCQIGVENAKQNRHIWLSGRYLSKEQKISQENFSITIDLDL